MSDLLTLPEVADQLRVSVKTVHRLIASGDLPAFKVRHATRVRQSDVDAVLVPIEVES